METIDITRFLDDLYIEYQNCTEIKKGVVVKNKKVMDNIIKRAHEILRLCDDIHSTGIDIINEKKYVLPTDEVYEKYKQIFNYNTVEHITESSVMIMGSVLKVNEPVEIQNCIFMPKYDGVSVSIQFILDDNVFKPVKANTRGRDTGTKTTNTNLTEQITNLIKFVTINLPGLKEFTARGEILLKHKNYNEKGQPTCAHASIVAGYINGKIEHFIKNMSDLCIQFYEIGHVSIDTPEGLTKIIPTQLNALNIIHMINVIYFDDTMIPGLLDMTDDINTTLVKTIPSSLQINYQSEYENIVKKSIFPTDGIIYTSLDWVYPTDKSLFNKTNYGKYAWKPNEIISSRVVYPCITWTMSRNGELNPTIEYQQISVGGKNYSKAKSSFSQLLSLIQNGFGEDALISVVLVNSIIPHVDAVITSSRKIYSIPVKCMFCDSLLINVENKHLMCKNVNCVEQLIQKYAHLISKVNKICNENAKSIAISSGISKKKKSVKKKASKRTALKSINDANEIDDRKLIFKNKNGDYINTSISEATLREIYNTHGLLSMEIIQTYIPNLFEKLGELSIEDQLIALNFGGKTDVRRLLNNEFKGVTSFVQILDQIPWLN